MSAKPPEPFPLTMGAYDTIAQRCTALQRENEQYLKAASDWQKQIIGLQEEVRKLRRRIHELETGQRG